MKFPGKIKQQIEQNQDLFKIISTMKNISIVNTTHFKRKVQAVRNYARTIESGFQILLKNLEGELIERLTSQKPPRRTAVVMIGSEKGLCGEFNGSLLHFFENSSLNDGETYLITIGQKLFSKLGAEEMFEFPHSSEAVSELLRDLFARFEEKKWGRLLFFHHQLQKGLQYKPVETTIFPLNIDWLKSLKEKPWPSRCYPLAMMADKSALFYELTREWIFIAMYQALVESLASENVARLSAMEGAEKNLENRLSDLKADYQRERQEQITEELFDIFSDFEAF